MHFNRKWFKLALSPSLREMIWICKCIAHVSKALAYTYSLVSSVIFNIIIQILYLLAWTSLSLAQQYNTIQIFVFPIKEPFGAEQLTKNLIQWLWIDYIDWKMTTFYETTKSKLNHHTTDIVIVAFECMLYKKDSDPSVVK